MMAQYGGVDPGWRAGWFPEADSGWCLLVCDPSRSQMLVAWDVSQFGPRWQADRLLGVVAFVEPVDERQGVAAPGPRSSHRVGSGKAGWRRWRLTTARFVEKELVDGLGDGFRADLPTTFDLDGGVQLPDHHDAGH